MEPYLIVFQFNSLYQILSGFALILLILSTISFLKINKKHKEKLIKLDDLIAYLESKKKCELQKQNKEQNQT